MRSETRAVNSARGDNKALPAITTDTHMYRYVTCDVETSGFRALLSVMPLTKTTTMTLTPNVEVDGDVGR